MLLSFNSPTVINDTVQSYNNDVFYSFPGQTRQSRSATYLSSSAGTISTIPFAYIFLQGLDYQNTNLGETDFLAELLPVDAIHCTAEVSLDTSSLNLTLLALLQARSNGESQSKCKRVSMLKISCHREGARVIPSVE